jgi:predicted enzyme related to lactoylglutathione lyase
MAERTSYAPGTFSWAELATSDATAAKSFYTAVFGWEYDDIPIGDDMVYSMARVEGKSVAALFKSEQPPHWNSYVTVESVDASAARAAELGATVTAEPFDVMDAGRSAVLADPAGAAIHLWEAKENIGAYRVNEPGAMTWNELVTPDVEAAARFYGDLFGWTTEEMPESGGYRVIRNGGRSNGGMMRLDPEQMGDTPPQWMPYCGHPDVPSLVDAMGGHGGHVVGGPMEMASGKIAIFLDPQGAAFAAWSGL